ncbi:MAG: type II toxin-antitoxin system RelE/ParE family toxin [Bacteroidales bacterium]|nr:type II toxin-antitoxin system RelE/ParE family toxin [Bacteroidales bacterium]
MKVEWSETAERNRDQIADYIFYRFGYDSMARFVEDVEQAVSMIESHPHIGPVEPLLADRAQMYRSLTVDKLSKMIYRVDGEAIYIVDFWDVRREPPKIG